MSVVRVLLIDDEADLLDLCSMALEGEGHQTVAISEVTRPAVLDAFERFDPQLVLLDLVMPRVSGEQVARWLRGQPGHPAPPIAVMSALSDGEVRARHLGAQAFLAKPFSEQQLLAALREATRRAPDLEVRSR